MQVAWPAVPHMPAMQPPAMQVPPLFGQAPAAATHTPIAQQPPFAQVFPSQQAWPAAPHIVQLPFAMLQLSPVPMQ
jgi:hypothetical protein